MAAKIRQIVPMASPDIAYFTGMVYVASDAEADRLEAAGLVEVMARGVKEEPLVQQEIPEGAMASPLDDPAPIKKGGGKKKANATSDAGDAGTDGADTGEAPGGDSNEDGPADPAVTA